MPRSIETKNTDDQAIPSANARMALVTNSGMAKEGAADPIAHQASLCAFGNSERLSARTAHAVACDGINQFEATADRDLANMSSRISGFSKLIRGTLWRKLFNFSIFNEKHQDLELNKHGIITSFRSQLAQMDTSVCFARDVSTPVPGGTKDTLTPGNVIPVVCDGMCRLNKSDHEAAKPNKKNAAKSLHGSASGKITVNSVSADIFASGDVLLWKKSFEFEFESESERFFSDVAALSTDIIKMEHLLIKERMGATTTAGLAPTYT